MKTPVMVTRAAREREQAEKRFREEIRTAYASGAYTLAVIAEAAGLSTVRIWQIVNHRR